MREHFFMWQTQELPTDYIQACTQTGKDEGFYSKVGIQNIQGLRVAVPVMYQKIPVFFHKFFYSF
jgi:hypothetical protein